MGVHLSFSDISNIPEVHFMDEGNDIFIPGQQTEVVLGNALASKYEIVVKFKMLRENKLAKHRRCSKKT